MKNYIKHNSTFLFPLLISILSLAPPLGAIPVDAQEITSATLGTTFIDAMRNGENTGTPLYIYIPSINLFTNMEGVGVDKKGNMDVPSGRTNNVGWYEYGIVPGQVGTAVVDAHNTAAFKNLDELPVGGDIYIFTSTGKWLHFVATKAKTYLNKTLSRYTLFAPTDTPQLNLITCAGTLLGNGEATHRLIVSAQLV